MSLDPQPSFLLTSRSTPQWAHLLKIKMARVFLNFTSIESLSANYFNRVARSILIILTLLYASSHSPDLLCQYKLLHVWSFLNESHDFLLILPHFPPPPLQKNDKFVWLSRNLFTDFFYSNRFLLNCLIILIILNCMQVLSPLKCKFHFPHVQVLFLNVQVHGRKKYSVLLMRSLILIWIGPPLIEIELVIIQCIGRVFILVD